MNLRQQYLSNTQINMYPIANSFIISLSDESDDDCSSLEDDSMKMSVEDDDDILQVMASENDSDIERNVERMHELIKIDDIMMENMNATDTQYSMQSPCEIKKLQVYTEKQISTIIEYFTSKFNFSSVHNQAKKRSAPNAIVPFPAFLDFINFSNIRWLTIPNVLFSETMLEQINSVTVPWIYNDEKEEQKELKQSWIDNFNLNYMDNSCIDNCFRKFICLEICHLKCGIYDANKQEISGVVGISAALVHNENGKLTVLDFANIKIGCNARNYAYGDFGKMLLQTNTYDALFIYCAEYGSVISTFMSNLFPWSPFILYARTKGKIINLIKPFTFNIIKNELDLCIDAKTHSKACSMCNLTMFLLNIGCTKYLCTKRELKYEYNGNIQNRLINTINKSNHISHTIGTLFNNPRNLNINNRPIYLVKEDIYPYIVNIRKCQTTKYIETNNKPLLFTYNWTESIQDRLPLKMNEFLCNCAKDDFNDIHSCEDVNQAVTLSL